MEIKVFQAGTLPGTEAFTGGVQPLPSGSMVRTDSLVYPQELTQVTSVARELYRPLRWREILTVEPVATWARRIEDRKIQTLVEDPVHLTNKAPTQELPMPAITTSNSFISVFAFGLAYGYTDEDIEYASKLGIGLESENVHGCNLSVEQFLERVMAVGHSATGMKGLGNLADVSTATAVTKAATGTTWAVATAAEIFQDLCTLVEAVELNSKETSQCNIIVLPIAQYNLAAKTFTTANETTALDLFRRIYPGVAVRKWNKLSNQGAGGTPCAMAWDTRDPYGPRALMQRELQWSQALRGTNGWLVPGKFATGGVRCKNPTAVVKMSGL